MLFFVASLGLLWQTFNSHSWSDKLLACAIFLMCLEQGRMALVDLDNIKLVKQKYTDSRIDTFSTITIITIMIELLGFYSAFLDLSWGGIVVIISLIFFNICTKIKLHPSENIMIEPWGISQRLPILLTNGLALILISLRMFEVFTLLISSILLGLTIAYGVIKYGFMVNTLISNLRNSLVFRDKL
ncbi:MAG: hypothetical protein WBM62_11205 [Crocosphaera sp.]